MKKQIYSLQGIIFQKSMAVGTAYMPGIGIAATINKVMNYGMFHAVVSTDEVDTRILSGMMSDRWGISVITDFIMNENGLTFQKQYENRPPINYSFRECKENIWYGTYSGPDCGKGAAKLIVTPIEESFFEPVDGK